MNIEADLPGRGWNPAVQREIDQILQMWRVALQASGGPFLFGAFGLVGAFYAPSCPIVPGLMCKPQQTIWRWQSGPRRHAPSMFFCLRMNLTAANPTEPVDRRAADRAGAQ